MITGTGSKITTKIKFQQTGNMDHHEEWAVSRTLLQAFQ